MARSSCTTRACAERPAHLLVEEQRIFAQLLREESLGQSRNEDDLEGAAARLVRAADKHAAVAIRRRLLVERPQPLGEDVARFLEAYRTDGAHRAQLAEHAQHACRTAEHPWRQFAEPFEPLAPGRALWP